MGELTDHGFYHGPAATVVHEIHHTVEPAHVTEHHVTEAHKSKKADKPAAKKTEKTETTEKKESKKNWSPEGGYRGDYDLDHGAPLNEHAKDYNHDVDYHGGH